MPQLIALALLLIVINWVRGQLGLTWEQFGILAAAIPVVIATVWFLLRDRSGTPEGSVGPELTIDYVDAHGQHTRRSVSIMRLTTVRRGRLELPARFEAYCYLVGDRRTFRIDRIEAATAGGQPVENLHDWLAVHCRAQTDLLARDDRMWTPDLLLPARPIPVPIHPIDLLIPGSRSNGQDLVVTADALVVTRAGSVVAIEGVAANPRRRRTIRLHQVGDIADAATGELIEGDPQSWLRSGRIGGAPEPEIEPMPAIASAGTTEAPEPASDLAPATPPEKERPRPLAKRSLIFAGLLLAALGGAYAVGVFGGLTGQPTPPQATAALPSPAPQAADAPPSPIPQATVTPGMGQADSQQVPWPTDPDVAQWLQRIAADIAEIGEVETLAVQCGMWTRHQAQTLDRRVQAARNGLGTEANLYVGRLMLAGADWAKKEFTRKQTASCVELTPTVLQTLSALASGTHSLWQWPDATQ